MKKVINIEIDKEVLVGMGIGSIYSELIINSLDPSLALKKVCGSYKEPVGVFVKDIISVLSYDEWVNELKVKKMTKCSLHIPYPEDSKEKKALTEAIKDDFFTELKNAENRTESRQIIAKYMPQFSTEVTANWNSGWVTVAQKKETTETLRKDGKDGFEIVFKKPEGNLENYYELPQ